VLPDTPKWLADRGRPVLSSASGASGAGCSSAGRGARASGDRRRRASNPRTDDQTVTGTVTDLGESRPVGIVVAQVLRLLQQPACKELDSKADPFDANRLDPIEPERFSRLV
jgi:hypothetical protein